METIYSGCRSEDKSYLYLISTLKSSAVIDGATRHAFGKTDYLPNLIRGIRILDAYVTGRKPTMPIILDYRLEILTAGGDEPWQARLAIRYPSGWSPSRFKAVVLDRWHRSPWIAYTDVAIVAKGNATHLPFLSREWDGRLQDDAQCLLRRIAS